MGDQRKALLVVLLAGALAFGGACSKDNSTPAPSGGSTTTKAGSSTTGTKAAQPGTTEAAKGKELSNTDIRRELSSAEPDLWSLVNFDFLSWNAFGGYNVVLVVGADSTKAVELCEAFSALVYNSDVYEPQPDTPIVIAVPADASDVTGTPVAKRESKSDTCKAS